jgi:hypothetical protein
LDKIGHFLKNSLLISALKSKLFPARNINRGCVSCFFGGITANFPAGGGGRRREAAGGGGIRDFERVSKKNLNFGKKIYTKALTNPWEGSYCLPYNSFILAKLEVRL